MKLRIKENSIRLRLTKSEVEIFGTEGTVEDGVDFGGSDKPNFRYVLQKDSTQNLRASFDGQKMAVFVPNELAGQWVKSEQVGIEGQDGGIQILIEKDFACIKPREGEDESDNFPHPNVEVAC